MDTKVEHNVEKAKEAGGKARPIDQRVLGCKFSHEVLAKDAITYMKRDSS